MQEERFEELFGLLLNDNITVDQMGELVEIATEDSQKLDELRQHLHDRV